MTVQQLPAETGVFARYLAELTGRIDRADGWYAIFLRRDPDGMRACLDGVEVPPWDVVESLLHDLAAVAGGVWTEREAARARSLHSAAAAAHDRLPGGRDALQERLELMLREEIHAKTRAEGLLRLLAAVPSRSPEAERLTNELAWTRDDHARAMARVTELTTRLAALPPPGPAQPFAARPAAEWAPPDPDRPGQPARPAPCAAPVPDHGAPHQGPAPVPATAGPRTSPDPDRPWPGEGPAGHAAGQARPGGALSGDPAARPGPGPRSASASDHAGWPAGTRSGHPAGPVEDGVPSHPAQAAASDVSGRGTASGSGSAPDPCRSWAGEDTAGSPADPAGYPARSGDESRSASASEQAGRPGGGAWTGDPVADPATPSDARPGGADHPAPAAPARGHAPAAPARGHAPAAPARGHAPDGSGYGHAPDVPGDDPARDAPGRSRPQDASGPSHASPIYADRPAPAATAAADTTPSPPPPPKKRRRRGGARFAGVEDDGGAADGVPGVPVLPVPEAGDVPRGARYGGAAAGPAEAAPSPGPPDVALRAARETVAALRSLRSAGLGGEAHVVLCEAAARPADWLPPLADELDRAGLAADRSTLLWEVASQPATRLAAAAELLDASGRAEDARQLLHQGVVRPAEEIADAVLALDDDGRPSRAAALLAAYVRARSAEDAARLGARAPGRLVPRLLDAAREVSASRERDLVHALRVAGHLGT